MLWKHFLPVLGPWNDRVIVQPKFSQHQDNIELCETGFDGSTDLNRKSVKTTSPRVWVLIL